MTRIALTTAAMLLAMGSAFAGSDHFDGNNTNNTNQSTVDGAYTASVGKHDVTRSANVDTDMKTGAADSNAWPTPGHDNWGN
jgi:hypothetical protein